MEVFKRRKKYIFLFLFFIYLFCSCDRLYSFFFGKEFVSDKEKIEQEICEVCTYNGISVQKKENVNIYKISFSEKYLEYESVIKISFEKDNNAIENVFTNYGCKGKPPEVIKNGSLLKDVKKTLFKTKNKSEYSLCIRSADDKEVDNIVLNIYTDENKNNKFMFLIKKNVIKYIGNNQDDIDNVNQFGSINVNKVKNTDIANKFKNIDKVNKFKNTGNGNFNTFLKNGDNIYSSNIEKNGIKEENKECKENLCDIDELFKRLKGNIVFYGSKVEITKKEKSFFYLKDKLQIWFEDIHGNIICKKNESCFFKDKKGKEILSGTYIREIKDGFLKKNVKNNFEFSLFLCKECEKNNFRIKITCEGSKEEIYLNFT